MNPNLPIARYFVLVTIFASALFAIFTLTLYYQSRERDTYMSATVDSYETVRIARLVSKLLLDIETGQRGYLLTRSREFLEPYNDGLKNLYDSLDQLEHMKLNDEQKQRVVLLRKQIGDVINVLQAHVALFENPRARPITVRDLRETKHAMDGARSTLDSFISTERDTVAVRSKLSKRLQHRYVSVLFIGGSMSVGALLLAMLFILRMLERSRETRTELERTRETYRMLMESLNDGIYDYIPATGQVLYSPSYARMLGYEPGEIDATVEGVSHLLHPDDRAPRWAAFEKYIKHETPTYATVFRLRHKDGSWRWILSRGMGTWDRAGNLVRMLGIHTDITEQKLREEELKQLNTDLESFIYITSHDLRAPLVNLKGFAGEIAHSLKEVRANLAPLIEQMPPEQQNETRTAFEEDIPEALGFIHSSVERMDSLTTAILDLSRIGRREFRAESIEVAPLVRRCLNSLAYEINQKKVQVDCTQLPTITTDPVALEQVFGNILDNAIKYLDAERPGSIRISAEQTSWETHFSIADNGRGIGPNDYKKVFDIFRRASNSGNVRGSGMGMAYVRALLRKLGGRIWFESTLNEGTTFHFTIPVQPMTFDQKERA